MRPIQAWRPGEQPNGSTCLNISPPLAPTFSQVESITIRGRRRWLTSWPAHALVFLTMGYVLFGANAAAICSAPPSVTPWLDAALTAAMAILGLEWCLTLVCRQQSSWLLLALDAVMVRLILQSHSLEKCKGPKQPRGEFWDSLRCAHWPQQVALIVVDISWVNLPISQYSYTTLETRRNGAQQLASAAILVTRAGRMARLLNAVHLKFVLEVGALSSFQQFLVLQCYRPTVGIAWSMQGALVWTWKLSWIWGAL